MKGTTTGDHTMAVGIFGELIRAERNRYQLSLRGFAAHVGTSRSAVWHWEHGNSVPSPATVRRISEVFQIPLVTLALAVVKGG